MHFRWRWQGTCELEEPETRLGRLELENEFDWHQEFELSAAFDWCRLTQNECRWKTQVTLNFSN